ncbi:alpha/beta-hydrolase [Backusella circina FSU 941]|nr:alpha/beta-hydrolase [Backusella circina FSU 941]
MIPSSIVFLWIMVESLFYINFVYNRNRLQAHIKPNIPLTKQKRTELFWNCVHTVKDIKSWSEGWFYYANDYSHPHISDIKRDNFALWFAWAFWHDHLDIVRQNQEWSDEIEWMMDTAQAHFKHEFNHGFNDGIECIRLNLDPVQAIHRPLFVYLILYAITILYNEIFLHTIWNFVQGQRVQVWGSIMKYVDQCYYTLKSFFFPPTAPFEEENRNTKKSVVSYYYKPVQQTESETIVPIVFIHGIGIGTLTYAEFVHRLGKLNRPLFLVELPYVSMHMVDNIPNAYETVNAIQDMLHHHHYKQAIFVSHSLGTGATSWLMNIRPELVAGTVMIDPICFLLHYHHVAFNFVHRVPINLLEYVMHYGVARELYISNYLSRHFQWYEGIYFASDAPTSTPSTAIKEPMKNATVFLSELDRIVGSQHVHDYLKERNIDVHLMPGLEHAGFIMSAKWKDIIVKQIEHIANKVG